MKLIIGNKNYSSWSLRPWLVLKHFKIGFDEVLLRLDGAHWKENLVKNTPFGCVPVLEDGDLVIGETIAIIEYLAEKFPDRGIWPEDRVQRALARAASAKMHAGFADLRNKAPMNLHGSFPGRIAFEEIASDMEELENLLSGLLENSSGPFLFGEFCAADAMFAPVAARIKTYDIATSARLKTYFEGLYALDAYQEWLGEALREPWIVAQDEIDPVLPDGSAL